MPPLVEYVEWAWSSTWAEIGPKQVRPVAHIVGGWRGLPPNWADVADMFFFCSDGRLCSVARSCEFESDSRTSGDSNHHRQSVSVKRNAIPIEPRGRLTKWGEAMLRTCWLETVNWDDVALISKIYKLITYYSFVFLLTACSVRKWPPQFMCHEIVESFVLLDHWITTFPHF